MAKLLTADDVNEWWQHSSKEKPLPDLGRCAALASTVDLCWHARGRTDRRLADRPAARSIDVLKARIPEAEDYWRAARAQNDGTVSATNATFVLDRLAQLKAALNSMAADWLLEPLIEVVDLGWQVDAKFLYPKVVTAWVHAGHAQARPHADSPACRFLEKALAHLGWLGHDNKPRTSGAIAKMLRDAGLVEVDVASPLQVALGGL